MRTVHPFELLARQPAEINTVFSALAAGTAVPRKERATSRKPARKHVRALFISDLHLGAISCRADAFLDFFDRHSADVIYLVGDIFDTWRPLGSNWRAAHNRILAAIMERSNEGVPLIYIPGNHDGFFRKHLGTYFGSIEVAEFAFHTTADGRRMLVTHGDECDVFERRAPWLAKAGSHIESGLLHLNGLINRVRRKTKRAEWFGIENGLSRVNRFLRAHDRFEERLSDLALRHGADGIICGHFHQPALHSEHGVIYANCGDWVENCTAIAEAHDGSLSLLEWAPRSDGQLSDPSDVEEADGVRVAL